MNFFLVLIHIATDLWKQAISQLLPHGKKRTLIECYFKQKQTQKQKIDMIIPSIRL